LHEKLGFSKVTDFEWLSDDQLVQKTSWEDGASIIVNFSDQDFVINELKIPAKSLLALESE